MTIHFHAYLYIYAYYTNQNISTLNSFHCILSTWQCCTCLILQLAFNSSSLLSPFLKPVSPSVCLLFCLCLSVCLCVMGSHGKVEIEGKQRRKRESVCVMKPSLTCLFFFSVCLSLCLSANLSMCHGFSQAGGTRRGRTKERGTCLGACVMKTFLTCFFFIISVSLSVCLCLCVMDSFSQVIEGEEPRKRERVCIMKTLDIFFSL